jgi:putative SOS response-associated peptidase YedK
VLFDDFHEWKESAVGKQPYAVALADQRLMATAGLSRTLALTGVPPRARPFRPRAHLQHTAAARR